MIAAAVALLAALQAPETDGIAVLTDAPDSRLVRSFRTLYPKRARLNDLQDCRSLVVHFVNPSALDKEKVLGFARSGGIVILGLEEYAELSGSRVTVGTMPNRNHIPPLDKEQIRKLVEASARICGNLPNSKPPRWLPPEGNLPEPWMNDLVRSLRKEVLEEVPRIRIEEACAPLTNGFAVGDTVPWCGQEDGRYVQRQIEKAPEGARVVAVSTLNGRPVVVRQDVGKGRLYAFDFRSLGEPEITWETRGSFNKYVFAGNILGPSIRCGRYWTKKPLAEEWESILKEVARRHPPLRVEVEGHTGGYNVWSLNLGDPSKPVWYAMGMYHAEDEWRSALGLVDFMRTLADRRDDPEIRARLERYCVKSIPCQTPTMYMKALRGDKPGPDAPIPAPRTEPANLVMAFSIHECDSMLQYGIIAMAGKSLDTVPKVEALHRARMADRFVEWEGAPRQSESRSWKGGEKTEAEAEKNRFYGFGFGFEHLACIGRKSFERLPYQLCIEGGRRGFLPEIFLQNYQLRGLVWEEDLYRSAVINETIASWALSAFLASP